MINIVLNNSLSSTNLKRSANQDYLIEFSTSKANFVKMLFVKYLKSLHFLMQIAFYDAKIDFILLNITNNIQNNFIKLDDKIHLFCVVRFVM